MLYRIRDFFLTFIIDFVIRRWFMIPLIAAYALYRYGTLPVGAVWAVIGVWAGVSFISALLITLVGRIASGSKALHPRTVNMNPYSKKTEDFLPTMEDDRR